MGFRAAAYRWISGDGPRGVPRLAAVIGALAIALGTAAAIRKAWLCDDAFISFRYAENLTRGLGLVYNAGERVEGYSNFLWTVWIALGMRLGAGPEAWSIAWGLCFYAVALGLLLADRLWPDRERGDDGPVAQAGAGVLAPVACMLAAAHPDWQVYATSGLETSLFTCLVTAGYLLATRRAWGVRGLAGAGAAFGLAALTRPDGLLFAPLTALWILATRRPRAASVAVFLGAFALLWAPHAIWKVAYYGDFFPNTYYAKSASLAWYPQGWTYLGLYFQRYWLLALAFAAAPLAWWVSRRARREASRDLALALILGVAYTGYVLRVGGDFMYARFLIPAAPFLIVALARGGELLLAGRPAYQWAAGAAAVMAVALSQMPLGQGQFRRGIADERWIYRAEEMERRRREGLILRSGFEGLPVRMAIIGTEASIAYYARPAVVIECSAGLTDRWIARQHLPQRGRVGHEKTAPVSYMLARRVHFVTRHFAVGFPELDERAPVVEIDFGGDVRGRILHWEPAIMDSLRRRGARFDASGELAFREWSSRERALSAVDGGP